VAPTLTGGDLGSFHGFRIAGRAAGYLPKERFLDFLDRVETGKGQDSVSGGNLTKLLSERGLWAVILVILLGGLALNLTPCVLPMIPVNIAIIGAGVQGGSRGRGFLLGGIYGAGIAVAYGVLGLVVVITGSQFGTLNSSPAFNFAIATLFMVLALSMFGAFSIDLSRFQGSLGAGTAKRNQHVAAFLMGLVAAALAGACVAPVVISVLLLAADFYNSGRTEGLLFPFLLGLGMALPWPFAGAGLSFLPKPGRWMEWVKRLFGLIILLAALWYGWTGWNLVREKPEPVLHEGWYVKLDQALAAARMESKPVLVDFWASWCKSCLEMDRTTFKDPAVVERLAGYIKLKYPAENPRNSAVQAVLKEAGIVGLPTYLVIREQ